ncbi:MAG TPA: restriction endonuclease subunit S [Humisphaera sp.]
MSNEWTRQTVAELQAEGLLLVEDGNHGEYRPRTSEFGSGSWAFIRAADMDGGTVLFESAERINDAAFKRIRKGVGKGGDVLFSHKGTVGKLAIAPIDAPSFVCSPQTTFWRTLDESRLSRRFLYYYMQSRTFTEQWMGRKGETDMADYVSLTAQRELFVSIPPPSEQQAIADVLGLLDDKIEQNRRTGRKLEALARAVFKAWFVDFEPVKVKAAGGTAFPGMPPATFAALPTRLVDSELGPVPEGWHSTNLGDEFDLLVGFAFKSADFTDSPDAIRLVRGDNVKEGWIEWGNKTRRWSEVNERINRYHLAAGDVVIGMDGSKLGKNWSRVREIDLPSLLVQRVARFRSTRNAGPSLLWLLISHSTFREFVDAVKTGTSIPHISGSQLKGFSFLKPGPTAGEIWCGFEEVVRPLLSLADHLSAESVKLAALRDYLLPRLLSGRVRVQGLSKNGEDSCSLI